MYLALQQNSAADLSMLVLEVLEKSETKVEEEILGRWQTFIYSILFMLQIAPVK